MVWGQALPEGPGATLVQARCVTCHEADAIVQQRLSRTGWEREVDKMMRWGAKLDADERTAIVTYLAERFTPTLTVTHTASSSGAATYRRVCLGCHGEDLIDQQRLTRAGWGREVDKMVRWGASVPATEKDALVDFLASRTSP
jgi:cytochrome c1